MKRRLEFATKKRYGVKWNLSVTVQLKQLSSYTEEERLLNPSFLAGPYTATSPEELEEQLHIAGDTIEVLLNGFQAGGSGFSMNQVNYADLIMNEYKLFRGSTYTMYSSTGGNSIKESGHQGKE